MKLADSSLPPPPFLVVYVYALCTHHWYVTGARSRLGQEVTRPTVAKEHPRFGEKKNPESSELILLNFALLSGFDFFPHDYEAYSVKMEVIPWLSFSSKPVWFAIFAFSN